MPESGAPLLATLPVCLYTYLQFTRHVGETVLLSELALQATKSFCITMTMCMYLEVALTESLSNHCDWILGLRSGVMITCKVPGAEICRCRKFFRPQKAIASLVIGGVWHVWSTCDSIFMTCSTSCGTFDRTDTVIAVWPENPRAWYNQPTIPGCRNCSS